MTAYAAAPHAIRPAERLSEIWRRSATLLVLIAAIALLALLAGQADAVLQRRVIFCLVNLVAVVGLYIFMGNSGVLNFSVVGFMAIGAYTSALLSMPAAMKGTFLPDLPLWLGAMQVPHMLALLTAGVVPALIALLVGFPIMRLSGIGAAIATLSLLFIAYIVLGNWDSLTGGQGSLMGLQTYVKLPVAAAVAGGAVAVAFWFQETRWGIALRASREDEVAARASGIRIPRVRLIAFVLGAFVAGVAGALFAHFQGTLRVENFYLDLTFLLMTMLVVGGSRSLTGAVAGTFAISLVTELLRQTEVGVTLPGAAVTLQTPAGLGDVALAGVMLVIILFRPNGISGGREIDEMWRRRAGRKHRKLPEERNA
ncbi:branched-chain amino acid ABC transporter permease [Paracoccus sp. S-4012]|uniref:branched-chain amino acid ABC transporter permease n=1 Tax=Paracoccus sp. S-4012 TaxID=2665648 RepID=UPI0012AFE468|nr:branched-chain amino acid ABC transporter permease [Paracoccus sp. S-4012]MRX52280.1 branched-chain amino acid ABC transporter permease [Paracoccus sp. S-4012]